MMKMKNDKVLLTFLHSFERCYSNKKMFSNTTGDFLSKNQKLVLFFS